MYPDTSITVLSSLKVLDTLTYIDYVAVVLFSSSSLTVSALGATTMMPATPDNIYALKQ